MKAQSIGRRIGIYVGTFDPLTNGHCDVIRRASALFENLTVAVGENVNKNAFFSVAERVQLISEVAKELGSNIIARSFSGLAVNFANSIGASVMVRGLRTEADYTYEMQMATMNKNLCADIETIFIPTSQELSHISSSLVKEVAVMGGDVSRLVPVIVNQRLREKILSNKKA